MLEEGKKHYQSMMIPKIVLAGKPYIYKEKQVAWAQYINKTIKTGKSTELELEETISIMKMLHTGQYSIEEMIELLRNQEIAAEELCHIIKNLLYYYKDGPAVFRIFYKGYMTPQLDGLICLVEEENSRFEQNQNKVKKYK